MYCCLFGHEWDLPKTGRFLQTAEVRERWWTQILFVSPACLQRIRKFFEFSLNSGNRTQIPAPSSKVNNSLKAWLFPQDSLSGGSVSDSLHCVFLGCLTFVRCTCFSVLCSAELFLTLDTHRLWTVMYTRSPSVALMLFILNPGNGKCRLSAA